MQALEDLIVQTEIFLQYSLQAKALERLQKIAAMFPGEEERHPRLRNLYQMANWWPQGGAESEGAGNGGHATAARTHTRAIFKHYDQERRVRRGNAARPFQDFRDQPENFSAANAASDAEHRGQRGWRIFARVASSGGGGSAGAAAGDGGGILRARDCGPAPGAQVVFLLAHMEKAQPDELGGLMVDATDGSILSELGLATALGVIITDKDTGYPRGC